MRAVLAALLLAAAPSAAQITVTSAADAAANDGTCTLREAIVAANTDAPSGAAAGECAAGSGADTVTIALASGTVIALTSALPTITEGLTLDGGGAVVDGADAFRLVDFDPSPAGETITLRRLTLQRGRSSAGGAVLVNGGNHCVFEDLVVRDNVSTNGAGGIYGPEQGTCTLDRVAVLDNLAEGPSGGGGMRVSGGSTVTIRNSTVAGNAAPTSAGGGILVAGFSAPATTFTLEQSTVSGNTAQSSGGGIVQIGSFAASTLTGVTVTGNALTGTTGGGGGISFDHTLALRSTIVAGNTSARDAAWADVSFGVGTATSLGGNVIGVNGFFSVEFPAGAPNAGGDLVGTAAAPLAPGLSPLGDHGGPTPTHLLLAASPALDAGRCAGAATDQRGAPRELDEPGAPNGGGDACDSGAVEGTAPFVGLDAPPDAGVALGAPFPSPAAGDSAVRVALERAQAVRLVVVDVLGREVARVLDGPLAAGDHRVRLPTALFAPGLYVVRLDGAGWTATRTLAVAR